MEVRWWRRAKVSSAASSWASNQVRSSTTSWSSASAAGSKAFSTALEYGGRYLRPMFARPIAWRILDGFIAIIMVAIGISLLI